MINFQQFRFPDYKIANIPPPLELIPCIQLQRILVISQYLKTITIICLFSLLKKNLNNTAKEKNMLKVRSNDKKITQRLKKDQY